MATRIAAQKAALTEVAISDPLTGLHNRRSFEVRLAEEVERTRRSQVPFALLLLDLDHFKQVNDRFGHQAGDQALQAVASVLEQQLRAVDLPARIGGEEFAVLLPDTAGQGALDTAERLRAAIATRPIAHEGATIAVTASIGVACCSAHADTSEGLLRVADLALYQAKRAGRNRTHGAADVTPLHDRV
jgi:diguanylate cyclase (GGDEF)-like protein